jgi:hypothetical protein
MSSFPSVDIIIAYHIRIAVCSEVLTVLFLLTAEQAGVRSAAKMDRQNQNPETFPPLEMLSEFCKACGQTEAILGF